MATRDTADAVIVGGGVMGCSILHALAERGMPRSVLLEKDALSSGATSRSQGILRMHYSNEVTSRLAWESLKVFRHFEQLVGGSSGYVKAGYLLIVGPKDRGAMEENVRAQRELDIRTDVLSTDRLRDVSPAVAVLEDEACAYEPESGYADPYSVTHAYAAKAKELGAAVRTGSQVTDLLVDKGRVTGVATEGGTVSTRVAVIAAGPWSRPLLDTLGVPVPLDTVRHQVIMLRRPRHHIFAHPVVGDVVNGLSARPEVGDMTLVGVGEDERGDPDDYDHGVDMHVVKEVTESLAVRMPGMSEGVFRGGWSGLFTTTPDWHPVIDRVEGIDGLYVAVGFSGHGFKLAPMVGVAMAEMITAGVASTVDVLPLRLKRFEEHAELGSRYGMRVLA